VREPERADDPDGKSGEEAAPAMGNRYENRMRQAEADLRHARNALKDGDFQWSCFAVRHGAEKALRATSVKHGMEAWGHTLTALTGNLPKGMWVAPELMHCAKILDKHYIPTRCPNGFDSGAPTDFCSQEQAEKAHPMCGGNPWLLSSSSRLTSVAFSALFGAMFTGCMRPIPRWNGS